jgi:hypothetical protein
MHFLYCERPSTTHIQNYGQNYISVFET